MVHCFTPTHQRNVPAAWGEDVPDTDLMFTRYGTSGLVALHHRPSGTCLLEGKGNIDLGTAIHWWREGRRVF